jgi:hypothetical protein
MKKLSKIIVLCIATMMFTGCGESLVQDLVEEIDDGGSDVGSGSGEYSPVSAASILIGNTYYTADIDQNVLTYTTTEYFQTEAVFTDYTEDGKVLDNGSADASYESSSVTLRMGDAYSTCEIEDSIDFIITTCHNDTENWTAIIWKTLELAKANPNN